MRYCPYCVKPVDDDEARYCPDCGGNLAWTAGETQMPVGTLLEGTLLSYRLGGARGQGGFGVTYTALEQEHGVRVAIKEYFPIRCALRNPDQSVSAKSGMEEEFEKGYDNFFKEVRRLAGIRPLDSVVHVKDCFKTGGTAYLVMEYLDGVPLFHKLQEMGGKIPANDLLPKLPALIRDLAGLHEEGILHRDISPDNILWMTDDTLKLIDFGSARSMEGDKSMTVLLKHGFAPIEQYLTKGQGTYTDVYALAATIYYALTGVIPPSAVDRLEDPYLKTPLEFGSDLTRSQNEAIIRGLAIQPNERIQTMDDFAAAFFASSPDEEDNTIDEFGTDEGQNTIGESGTGAGAGDDLISGADRKAERKTASEMDTSGVYGKKRRLWPVILIVVIIVVVLLLIFLIR
ncbi:MAG: serine/threonine protein kinase [Lachnospiraceae bacterium]|nr:serine/threonine protein kinase [Lachnospiraceae bacterium]